MSYITGILIGLLSILPVTSCLSAQSPWGSDRLPKGGHHGAVHTLIQDEQGRLISAGADGFLGIWDIKREAAIERFQVSSYTIGAMVLRPETSQVSLLERDPIDRYRLSTWDYEAKQKWFTQDFRYPISYIAYSGGGNFLMLVQQGTPELLFLDAETGKPLKAPERTGVLSFVATGKSERTMIGYAPSGLLSYWDLESGKEIRRFIVPDRIGSPVLFGNNRFLVGIDPRGLVVLDAVSGNIIARDRRISQGKVLNLPGEAPELLCITPDADASRVYHVAISVQGKLELKTQWPVPLPWQDLMSATLTSDAVILGTLDGSVWIGKKDEKGGFMQERRQEPVIDIAATASFLAFLTKEETLGFIPLDYTQLLDKMVIPLSAAPYTRLASDPDAGETDTEGLLLWHEETAASLPRFMTLGEASSGESLVLDQLSRRFPLRSVALRGEAALFLDASGNITMLSARTGERLFSFASVAALDAALLKDGNILIGQSVIAGNTPFLMVNSRTGETLPLTLSASVGARVYCGASGVPYGVTVDPQEGRLNTTIIQLSLANPSRSSPVAVYPGEDTGFGMAEVQGSLVAALGGETAVRYGSKRKDALERTEGFPLRLIDGGSYCLVLDTEGTIAWYDPASGTLLACFHVYEYEWILEKPGYPLIRGGFKAAPQGEQAES